MPSKPLLKTLPLLVDAAKNKNTMVVKYKTENIKMTDIKMNATMKASLKNIDLLETGKKNNLVETGKGKLETEEVEFDLVKKDEYVNLINSVKIMKGTSFTYARLKLVRHLDFLSSRDSWPRL